MAKKPTVTADPRAALTNWLAPSALHWDAANATIGTQWARAHVAFAFPERVHAGWLSELAVFPDTMVSIHAVPADPGQVTSQLNKAIAAIEGQLLTAKNSPLMIQKLQSQHADANHLLKQVGDRGHHVWSLGVFAVVMAPDAEEGLRRSDRLMARMGAQGLRLRPLARRQDEGLHAAGPFAEWPAILQGGAPFQLPSEAVAATFPFAGGGINHGNGTALGRDSAGGLVLVDRWNLSSPAVQSSGVVNRNWSILATSGAGKSTAAKMSLLREWAMGATVIVIDPEREYKRMCEKLGGRWINIAGTGGQVIDPFVVPPVPADSDDTDEDEGKTPIAQHQYRVRTLLTLYLPDLTTMQQALLKQAIAGVYTEKHIALDADPAQVPAWPNMADLRQYCLAHQTPDIPEWSQLAALLTDAATGLDSRLFIGQHLAAPDASFIVLDTFELQNLDPNLQRAILFNALGYAWDLVARDREQKKILVVDEAWLMIDPKVPAALEFMQRLAKRARKYNCSFVVATQNVIDFLDPSVARQGQVVLGNSSFKLLLRQEPNDLSALADLFRLTDREQELLRSAGKGEGLLICGNQRVWCHVEPSGYELSIIEK